MNCGKGTRRDFLTVAVAAALGAWPASAQIGREFGAPSGAADLAAFDEVWETVRDRFYDPRLHGVDWQAVRARYRPQVAAARSRDETAAVVNAMLAELGASHTHYYTPDDPAYYQLADIFSYALASGTGARFPGGRGDLSGDRRVHAGRRSGPNFCNGSG